MTTPDPLRGSRAYGHWHLAESLAAREEPDDIVRGTVMQKLWNAVDQRVRLLHELYELRRLARVIGWEPKKDFDLLEILTRLGLVRPLALRQLREIRNAVEHADSVAPGVAECRNLVDLVWYFLRSTDVFVSRVYSDVERVDEDERPRADFARGDHFVGLEFPTDTWLPRLRGWFPSTYIGRAEGADGVHVVLDRATKTEGNRIFVSGVVQADSPALLAMYLEYFQLGLVDPRRLGAG